MKSARDLWWHGRSSFYDSLLVSWALEKVQSTPFLCCYLYGELALALSQLLFNY